MKYDFFLSLVLAAVMFSGCAARSHDSDVSVSVDGAQAYQSSVQRYDELTQLHRDNYEAEKKAQSAELNSHFDRVQAKTKPAVEAAMVENKKAEAQLYAQEQGVLDNAQLQLEQARLRELEKQAFEKKQ